MFNDLLENIKKHNTIIIYRHANPDGDALGSQFGLKEIIKLNFPKKKVFSYGSKDEIKGTYLEKAFTDFVDDNIEKDYKNSLSLILDTANSPRVKGKGWKESLKTIKIDHHPQTDEYCDIEIINTKASSTCEMLSQFVYDNNLKMNKKIANYLLIGVITDTGRFMFNSVTPETLVQASNLLETGVNIGDINQSLNDRTLSTIRLQAKIQSDFKTNGKVAYYLMPKNLHKKYETNYNVASAMIFTLMQSSDIKYGVFATFDERDETYRTSLRSKELPINELAVKYGGGGHRMASGIKLETKKQFKSLVKDLIELSEKE